MTQAIQPFDPHAAVEKMRERIRAMFADLIPPEQLDEMIKKEITAWMTPRTIPRNHYDNGPREVPSGFQTILRSVLEEETKVKLKDWLTSSPEWATFWSFDSMNGHKVMPVPGARACDLVAETMVKELPNVMRQILGQYIASVVTGMRNGHIP